MTPDQADQLLDGGGPAGTFAPVAALLQDARRVTRSGELPGEAAALAVFRASTQDAASAPTAPIPLLSDEATLLSAPASVDVRPAALAAAATTGASIGSLHQLLAGPSGHAPGALRVEPTPAFGGSGVGRVLAIAAATLVVGGIALAGTLVGLPSTGPVSSTAASSSNHPTVAPTSVESDSQPSVEQSTSSASLSTQPAPATSRVSHSPTPTPTPTPTVSTSSATHPATLGLGAAYSRCWTWASTGGGMQPLAQAAGGSDKVRSYCESLFTSICHTWSQAPGSLPSGIVVRGGYRLHLDTRRQTLVCPLVNTGTGGTGGQNPGPGPIRLGLG